MPNDFSVYNSTGVNAANSAIKQERDSMPNILIADYEMEIIKLLKIDIESDRINVLDANDGAQAPDILEKHEIDLAIVDFMMPKIHGYQD